MGLDGDVWVQMVLVGFGSDGGGWVQMGYGFVLNCVLGCGGCGGCVVVAIGCWQLYGGCDSDFPRLCLMSYKYYFSVLYNIILLRKQKALYIRWAENFCQELQGWLHQYGCLLTKSVVQSHA